MKLFAILPAIIVAAPNGGMDILNMDNDGLNTMFLTFKQFYNQMDHVQSMADFAEDDNGMFKKYFRFCDEGNKGLLTKDTHAACKTKIRDRIREEIKYNVEEYGLENPDVYQAKIMMDKLDATNMEMYDQMLDQYVDDNNDGSVTLEEIEMAGYCMFRVTAQVLIEVLDTNEDGKLNRTELNRLNDYNFEEIRVKFRRSGFDLIKTKELVDQADMNGDGAYDDRELAKVMFDITNMMIEELEKQW